MLLIALGFPRGVYPIRLLASGPFLMLWILQPGMSGARYGGVILKLFINLSGMDRTPEIRKNAGRSARTGSEDLHGARH